MSFDRKTDQDFQKKKNRKGANNAVYRRSGKDGRGLRGIGGGRKCGDRIVRQDELIFLCLCSPWILVALNLLYLAGTWKVRDTAASRYSSYTVAFTIEL